MPRMGHKVAEKVTGAVVRRALTSEEQRAIRYAIHHAPLPRAVRPVAASVLAKLGER